MDIDTNGRGIAQIDNSEPPTCECCGDEYTMDAGDEPTPFCDSCAHNVLEKRTAELADLRTTLARLTADLAAVTAERDEALADVAAAEAPLTDIVLRHHAAMSQVERERDEARGLLRDAMALVGQYENAVESASRMYHNTQEWGSDKEIEAMFQAVYDERGRIAAHLGRSE